MTVSVVIPAYNAEKFLEIALLSVESQTLKPAEVLVVDDGSTDSTVNIAEKHGVKILSNPHNQGIGTARHLGSQSVKTDYLTFLSADDAYKPNFLEETMRHATGKNAIFTNYYRCDKNLVPQTVFEVPCFSRQDYFRKLVIEWALKSNMFINFSTVVIPTWVFSRIQFDQDLRFGEDLGFLLKTLTVNLEWACVRKPLVLYRVHNQAGTAKSWNLRRRKIMWEHMNPLLIELGLSPCRVDAVMREQLRSFYLRAIVPRPIQKLYRIAKELSQILDELPGCNYEGRL